MASIWKDNFVILGTGDGIDFRIMLGTNIIYTGRAFKRPGASSNDIRINDIVADYLNNLSSLSVAEFSALTFPLSFVVQKNVSGTWTVVSTIQFINDWSYDDSYNPSTMGMSFPIIRRIDARQLILVTSYSAATVTATIRYQNGTTVTATGSVVPSDLTNDFNRAIRAAGKGTAVFDLSQYTNVKSVTIGNITYEVTTDCAEYALYYLNAYGGWDTLLLEGSTMDRDDLERHMTQVEYDNRNSRNRSVRNYANELTKVFTVNTGILLDDESDRMHHLLNSPDVYLYSLGGGIMLPVTINAQQSEHKTVASNDGRLFNYTIELSLSQNRLRR